MEILTIFSSPHFNLSSQRTLIRLNRESSSSFGVFVDSSWKWEWSWWTSWKSAIPISLLTIPFLYRVHRCKIQTGSKFHIDQGYVCENHENRLELLIHHWHSPLHRYLLPSWKCFLFTFPLSFSRFLVEFAPEAAIGNNEQRRERQWNVLEIQIKFYPLFNVLVNFPAAQKLSLCRICIRILSGKFLVHFHFVQRSLSFSSCLCWCIFVYLEFFKSFQLFFNHHLTELFCPRISILWGKTARKFVSLPARKTFTLVINFSWEQKRHERESLKLLAKFSVTISTPYLYYVDENHPCEESEQS